jgi:hypothetical protein
MDQRPAGPAGTNLQSNARNLGREASIQNAVGPLIDLVTLRCIGKAKPSRHRLRLFMVTPEGQSSRGGSSQATSLNRPGSLVFPGLTQPCCARRHNCL